MFKIDYKSLVVFLLALPLQGYAYFDKSWLSEQENQWLKNHPVLLVGVDPGDKPIDFVENGIHKGISADYRELLEALLGVELEVANHSSWQAMLLAAKSQDLDLILMLTKNKERESFLLFGELYFQYQSLIVTDISQQSTLQLEDLSKLSLVGVEGYNATDFLQRNFPNKFIAVVEDTPTALRMVSSGLADAMIGSSFSLSSHIYDEKLTNLKFSGEVIDKNNRMGFGVIKKTNVQDSEILLSILNKAFAQIPQSRRRQIEEKWFFVEKYQQPFWTLKKLMFAIVCVMAAMIFVIVYFNRKLRQLVSEKTAELENEKNKAEHYSQEKSRFLANVSHEIRTPLTGMLGVNELLQQTALNRSQLELLAISKSNTKVLLALINDVLDFSKIEEGKLELFFESVAIDDLVTDLIMSVEAAVSKKSIDIRWDIESQAPEFIEGDYYRLRQILLNLLSNAIKFTDEKGKIVLGVSVLEELDDTCTLAFSVEDDGMGIKQSQLELIFESFKQADNVTPMVHGGTGLGLSISKQLADIMHGRIDVESVEGEGSKFSFVATFKVLGALETEAKVNQQFENLPAKKVLIVEDNATSQLVLVKMLEVLGHNVTLAIHGQQALDILEKESFDVVLMDINMPVLDGLQTIKSIRNQEQAEGSQTQCVIAMTAHALKGDDQRMLDYGFDGYISKPIALDDLKKAIYLAVQ